MNFSLAERAFLNMKLIDVLYPYQAIGINPVSSYILEDIVFNAGKRIIINHLRMRDDDIDEQWPFMRNHHCLIEEGIFKCWCSCDAISRKCSCACFNCLYLLIDKIEEINGPLNRNAQMRFILASFNH